MRPSRSASRARSRRASWPTSSCWAAIRSWSRRARSSASPSSGPWWAGAGSSKPEPFPMIGLGRPHGLACRGPVRALGLLALAFLAVPRLAAAAEPPTVTYRAAGLAAPVEILVDTWGVPHIEARSLDDLFLAQGWNAARDRLWQIDLWRRRGEGTLSEALGPGYVEQDKAARLLLYRGDMYSEWLAYGPDAKRIATAFASGVNAFVRQTQADPALLPVEFELLGYRPALWSAE